MERRRDCVSQHGIRPRFPFPGRSFREFPLDVRILSFQALSRELEGSLAEHKLLGLSQECRRNHIGRFFS